MHTSLIWIARSVAVAGAVTRSLVAPVAAGEPVDPSTLNPPPPAEFNPECERLGGGIVCPLAFSDPPVDQASELSCDGDQIFESWKTPRPCARPRGGPGACISSKPATHK